MNLRPCLLLFCASLIAGCAAKSAPSKAPESPSATATPGQPSMGQPGMEVDEVRRGDGSKPSDAAPTDGPVSSEPDPLQSELDALEEDELRLGKLFGEGEAAELSSGAACPRACEALASMQRSVERICELTGDDDTRCGDAKTRLDAGRDRVAKASCGC